ncbi:unnamed protein product [Allacma fusca]|uniref:NWD2 C-terminal beta-propeller domain-containing protein n=1 Tax=Allacma fusca TaxID=39272 RepID=A0A8J2K6A7_9HEXA|nr:unnamed protein product [Allacma fusca]
MFNRTDEYVLYYHGGRKTIRVFRTSDAEMIADYRVPAELSSIDTTPDGKSLILGTLDGCLTILTIADPSNPKTAEYLAGLPSRNEEAAKRVIKSFHPFYFKTAAKMVSIAARARHATAAHKRSPLQAYREGRDSLDTLDDVESITEFTESTEPDNSAFTLPDTASESDTETIVEDAPSELNNDDEDDN